MKLRTRTVTVINREKAGEDPDTGDDVFDEVATVEDGWNVQPRSSSEDVQAAQQVISGLRAWGPLTSTVRPTSVVIPYGDGKRYEVDGDIGRWEPARPGRPGHVEVNLTRVTG